MKITLKEFLQIQPSYPQEADTDKYFLNLANILANKWDSSSILKDLDEELRQQITLGVIGYFQDIIADAGIWRSFSTMSESLYGTPVPLFERPEDYFDSELNFIDVQFLIWYYIECSRQENGTLAHNDSEIIKLAKLFFETLDAVYEEAPTPIDYNLIMDVDLNEHDQIHEIYDLSYWLFWNSYFLRPAATPTLNASLAEAHEIIKAHPDQDKARSLLADLNQRIMLENPTGPLSLFMNEWMHLIVNNHLPKAPKSKTPTTVHKFYKAFHKASGGSDIIFCNNYKELEDFLSHKMGWGETAEGHLPDLKECSNFVLYATPENGLLIAHDIAQYISHPLNTLYNSIEAKQNAHTLITEQGTCPIDLVKYLFTTNIVPDATLPCDPTGKLLHAHWDFFARLYLQSFYRAE